MDGQWKGYEVWIVKISTPNRLLLKTRKYVNHSLWVQSNINSSHHHSPTNIIHFKRNKLKKYRNDSHKFLEIERLHGQTTDLINYSQNLLWNRSHTIYENAFHGSKKYLYIPQENPLIHKSTSLTPKWKNIHVLFNSKQEQKIKHKWKKYEHNLAIAAFCKWRISIKHRK
jgi:hypothetical protein